MLKKRKSKNKGIIQLNRVLNDMKKHKTKREKLPSDNLSKKIDKLTRIVEENSRNLATIINDTKSTLGQMARLETRIDKVQSNLELKIEQEIESLAITTANSFSDVTARLEEVNKNLTTKIEDTKKGLDSRISGLGSRIDDAVHNRVNMQQHEHLAGRVQAIENKLAIK